MLLFLRYDELWMPLISDLTVVGSTTPMVLPPLDVEWVWFCHTLNAVIKLHLHVSLFGCSESKRKEKKVVISLF